MNKNIMKVKISFISDLHTKHWNWEVKMFERGLMNDFYTSDIIVFCGDMSGRGCRNEIEDFLQWFSNVAPNAQKIFIAGNHDFFFDTNWFPRTDRGAIRHLRDNNKNEQSVKEILEKYPDVIYLNDSGCEYKGVKFWGSPITLWFNDWAFNRWEDEIEQHWNLIPDDIDVLVTHGPPYSIGDLLHPQYRRSGQNNNVGCPILLREVENRIQPSIHAFGHIHEEYGIYPTIEIPGQTITYINASCLNENYSASNPPITVKFCTETKQINVV